MCWSHVRDSRRPLWISANVLLSLDVDIGVSPVELFIQLVAGVFIIVRAEDGLYSQLCIFRSMNRCISFSGGCIKL